MTFKKILAASTIGVAAVFAPVAHASYVDTFQGVTFTVDVVDSNTLSFRVENALSTTDTNWSSATLLGAFAFKDLGLDFSTVTATSTYLGSVTNGIRDELSNGGLASSSNVDCTAIVGSGETGSICFDYRPDTPLTDNMLFTLDFSSNFNISDLGPHLKIMFVDSSLNKVGSLYSQNIPSDGCCKVPEPASVALVGLGLLSMAAIRRRRSQA